jgi:hypothetical protein
MVILHRPHIDLVVIRVASQPFDENNAAAVINGGNQAIVIAL